MLIGELKITEVDLQVDTTDHSTLDFNSKIGTVVSSKKWRTVALIGHWHELVVPPKGILNLSYGA